MVKAKLIFQEIGEYKKTNEGNAVKLRKCVK